MNTIPPQESACAKVHDVAARIQLSPTEKPRRWHLTSMTAVAAGLFCLSPLAANAALATWQDDFSGVTSGTALQSVSGWSEIATSSGWTVDSTAGHTDNGISFQAADTYRRTLTGSEIATFNDSAASGGSGFTFETKFKLSVGGEDRNQVFTILIGKASGQTSAFVVRFFGNATLGASDNTISVSSGGGNWGTLTFSSVSDSAWAVDTWYTLQLTDVALFQSSDTTSTRTAALSIFETDSPGTTLLSNVSVTATASSGFDQIDAVQIRQTGAQRLSYIDDLGFAVSSIPEPSTAGILMGIGVGAMALCRRRPGTRKLG